MTHSTPFTVSSELESHFRKATEDASFRYFQIEIKDETLIEVFAERGTIGTNSLQNDFNTMIEHVRDDTGCYFLFRMQNPKEWLLITYVPDGLLVKNKMVMASAKGTLKDKLGHQFFIEELHTTSKDELSYEYYKGTKKQIDSRSNSEIVRDKILKEEEITRQEQIDESSGKTGGYHSVSIPLSESAKNSLNDLKFGSVNFIQLSIDDTKEKINSDFAKTVSLSQLEKEFHNSEPRFYVYNYDRGVSKLPVFIYCCPDKSPPKLRMVYSTSKPKVYDQIVNLGINLATKKIEIREGSEIVDELKSDLTKNSFIKINPLIKTQPRPSGVPDLGGVVKASHVTTIGGGQQHPIYSLMDQGNHEKPSGKKKIVIPPPGAYNS